MTGTAWTHRCRGRIARAVGKEHAGRVERHDLVVCGSGQAPPSPAHPPSRGCGRCCPCCRSPPPRRAGRRPRRCRSVDMSYPCAQLPRTSLPVLLLLAAHADGPDPCLPARATRCACFNEGGNVELPHADHARSPRWAHRACGCGGSARACRCPKGRSCPACAIHSASSAVRRGSWNARVISSRTTQPTALSTLALHVFGVRPHVAYVREGEGDDLRGVGGVGQHLLVTGHGGVEAHLAHHRCRWRRTPCPTPARHRPAPARPSPPWVARAPWHARSGRRKKPWTGLPFACV